MVFGPQEQQSPPTCTGCREQRSAARRKPGREAAAQHTHPRPPRAWGWPHAGIPVPTLPNGRELPPRVSAGFPHPAPGQKPVHPVSLSTRPQSRAHGLAPAANAPSLARQGPGRRNRTCRAPPRRAPVRPETAGQARPLPGGPSPHTHAGNLSFPTCAPRAQGRGAGGRRAGPRAGPRPPGLVGREPGLSALLSRILTSRPPPGSSRPHPSPCRPGREPP